MTSETTSPRRRSARLLRVIGIALAAFCALLGIRFVTVLGALAPTLTSLSPASGPVGTAVTISGANFVTGALVGKTGWFGPFQAGVAPNNLVVGQPNASLVGSPAFTADGGGAFVGTDTSYMHVVDGGSGGAFDWTSGEWSVQVDFAFPTTPVFPGGTMLLVSKGSFAQGNGWEIEINPLTFQGKYQIEMESNHGVGSYTLVTDYQIVPGQFHRALFTCDSGGNGTWYVNGVASAPQRCAAPASASTDLFIGRYSGGAGYPAGIPISGVQVWRRALTAAEAVQSTTAAPIPNLVTFNGTPTTPTSWTPTTIVAPVPIGATTGNVVVAVAGQASNGLAFGMLPQISTVSPASGAIGTSVTIIGTNFGPVQGSSSVTINGAAAAPISWSSTSVVVSVPAGATTGNIVVTVGGLASNGVAFAVAPAIANLAPTFGPIGTSVTITGSNFGATLGTSTVTFGGTTATPTAWSETSIVVPVPAGASSGNVVVLVGGQSSNGVSFIVNTANGSAPVITALSPQSGSVGTTVTVSGANFASNLQVGKIGEWGPFAQGVAPTNKVAGGPDASFVGSPAFTSDGGGAFWSTASDYLTIPGASYEWTAGSWSAQVDFVFPAVPNFPGGGSFVLLSNGAFELGDGWEAQINPFAYQGKYMIELETNRGLGNYTLVRGYQLVPGAFHRALFVCNVATGIGTWYVNGSAWQAQACAPSTLSGTSLFVGRYSYFVGNAHPATFPISHVQIWNRALSSDEAVQSTTTVSSSAPAITFNGTPATPTAWSATTIQTTVPSGATSGPVVVTVGGQSSNGVPFTTQ